MPAPSGNGFEEIIRGFLSLLGWWIEKAPGGAIYLAAQEDAVAQFYSQSSPWHFEDGEGDVPGDAAGGVGGGAAVHPHVLAGDAVDDEAVDPRPAVLAGGEAVDGDVLLGGGGEVARVRLGPRHLGRGHAARRALERRGLAAPHRDVLCERHFIYNNQSTIFGVNETEIYLRRRKVENLTAQESQDILTHPLDPYNTRGQNEPDLRLGKQFPESAP